jgi:hypothetical protein
VGDQPNDGAPQAGAGGARLSRRKFLSSAALGTAGAAAGLLFPGVLRTALSAPADLSASPSTVATEWFDLLLDIEQESTGFSPPVTSRAYAYVGITLYEALVAGMPGYRSLGGQLSSFTTPAQPQPNTAYHWPTVANSALAAIVGSLFTTAPSARRADVHALERYFNVLAGTSVPGPMLWDSVARGRQVAQHVFEWSQLDGAAEGFRNNYPRYERPQGPGLWSPTPPTFTRALQPYWGRNRPFVPGAKDLFDPGPPLPYSEEPGSAFRNEAVEVHDARGKPESEEEEIALFWSDDPRHAVTPPGHSLSIVTQVLRQHDLGLDAAAEAYARAGIAMADAFIACWDCKYRYNVVRPITYIRALLDPAWTSLVYTPPFPEYTSGHSAQSAAVALTLADQLGDLPFEDHTHDRRGFKARKFSTFSQFAEEAGLSRLYGGIHFRTAIERGAQQGKELGRLISKLSFRR